MKYKDYREVAATGDMLLFSGRGIASVGIKVGTRSPWSHIGTAVRMDEWDFLASWESTLMCELADLESGFVRRGVMLVPLAARVITYDGEVAVRRLRDRLSEDEREVLRDFRQEVKGRPYEKSWVELVKAGYDGPFGKNTQDLSSLFCSELFVEPWIRMGRIDEGLPANEYVPGDFGGGKFKSLWDEVECFDR